ncbi:toprim domain-containing protein [Azoarcus communis]|uniref:toprim domain-containing protein n=1 Tax=Parazoarcus communis TaxID=41977 RepID=UPI001459CC25|nr:toprim domain-containing protein [Parazoarcus communis]NMG46751.1 toprim domain-containing protein [Parazoarcus communis]
MDEEFMAAIAAAGLEPAKPLELIEGKLERFRVQGDKAGSRNGWAVLHLHPVPVGAFGSWKTGEQHTWKAISNEAMTPAQRAELQRSMQAAQEARSAEEARVRAHAAARALKLWDGAKPATNDHPYLVAKGVPAYGLRVLRDQIMVPARDADGRLHTLQFIAPDGGKRFLTGGRIAGCYFAIGRPDDALLLAEGYATGATLYQATGKAVAVCFNCGNLLPVARALRAKFPRLRFVICADNDSGTPGNPGLTAARAAAKAVGACVAFPTFSDLTDG